MKMKKICTITLLGLSLTWFSSAFADSEPATTLVDCGGERTAYEENLMYRDAREYLAITRLCAERDDEAGGPAVAASDSNAGKQ